MECSEEEMIDLTGMNDSEMLTDAELAEKLQMEELETVNQSDFEVAQYLQEMERRRASSSHAIPELFMFGEPMHRLNSGYRTESRRCRPPRPPPPWPTQAPRTSSNSDKHNADSGEPSADPPPSEDVACNSGHQVSASASSSATSSRYSLARRAQNARNRNRRDPAAPPPDGADTEPEHMQNAANHRDPVAAAAAQHTTASRVLEAINRNRRGRPAFAVPPNVTDAEQPRTAFYTTRNYNRLSPPSSALPPNDAGATVDESQDAHIHDHLDLMAPIAPPADAAGDAEPDCVEPPPVPPRRQRRSHRNRRFHGQLANMELLQFSMRPIADYHETLEMPGWAPVRRHYEYSRMLDDDDGSGNNYEALWALSEQIGEAANKGLNLTQITRLPTMKYKTPSSAVTSDDTMTSDDVVSSSSSSESISDAALAGMETVCRVCLCGFEQGEVLRALPCCHRFHVACIDQWIKQNAICPVCRDSIKDHFKDERGGGDQWNQYQ